jgi:phage tail-like protein
VATQMEKTAGAFKFFVEIDGAGVQGFFKECNLAGWETEVIEYREGGDNKSVRKLIGVTRYPNIVLKQGVLFNSFFWDWAHEVATAKVTKNTRHSGAVVLCSDDGSEAMRFTFERAWLCRWEGPTLKADQNEIAVEMLEIAHEGITKRNTSAR